MRKKLKLVKITVEEAKRKLPVIAGAGSNSTKNTIDIIKLLEKTGVDGFLIVTPYYNKPTQTGLYNHFKKVAASTKKAIVLYNIPGRTSINMFAETTLRLAKIKNIVAIKEASSNYTQISEIIKNAPKDFSVLSGNDDEILPLMATGAKGVISATANIAPKQISTLTKSLLNNNIILGRNLHHKLSNLFADCSIETGPIPVKAGMYRLKLINNILRSPLGTATKKTENIIAKTMKKMGIKK